MRHYGIIGKPLEHSFSGTYFTEKFIREAIDADYRLMEVEHDQISDVLQQLDGANITLPYKEVVIPLLQSIDPIAAEIGAVNVVHRGRGYNTDYIGFIESLKPHLHAAHKQALVLGSGGACKAICYGLNLLGITAHVVSRHPQEGQLSYPELTAEMLRTHTLIVNCTPLGMYPKTEQCPEINYSFIGPEHLLYDCIYNPAETLFLRRGREQGATIINGLQMLQIQAEEAWKIWNQEA